jgi:hypothetical protein
MLETAAPGKCSSWAVCAAAQTGERVSPYLDLRLLGDLEGVIDFDAEIPNRAFELGMPEQELDCTEIFGAPVNQRRFRSAHRVSPILVRIQPDRGNPTIDYRGVLTRGQMRARRVGDWETETDRR